MPPQTDPSASPGSSRAASSSEPTASITALAITVGTKGPGATARPSSSTTTTSSGRPKPEPPRASGRCRPEPAERGQLAPEGRELLGLRLEQGPGGPSGIAFGQEVRGRLAQGAVVFDDGNRHG